jgi:hypothetical protein
VYRSAVRLTLAASVFCGLRGRPSEPVGGRQLLAQELDLRAELLRSARVGD